MASSTKTKLNDFFAYLAQNTLLIIFLHYLFILIIFKFAPRDGISNVLYLIISCIILLFMYFPIKIIEKHLPFILNPPTKNSI